MSSNEPRTGEIILKTKLYIAAIFVGVSAVVILFLAGIPAPQLGQGGTSQGGSITVCPSNEISGKVYLDYNSNATQDGVEPPQADITVTAYNGANNPVATTLTAADGKYTLAVASGRYRLEFTGYDTYLYPGPQGSGSKTTVSFVTAASCDIDLGLSSPTQYCDPDPTVATPRYTSGNPLVAGGSATSPGILSFGYSQTGKFNDPGYISPVTLAQTSNVGAVWGMAYQRTKKKLFSSAVMKRHTGLGPLGTGGIYVTDYSDPNTPVTAPFIDLKTIGIDTGADPRNGTNQGLSPNPNDPSLDEFVFEPVGKRGLGDMDISEDEETLWVVNLNDRKLYSLEIANPTNYQGFQIPDPGCSDADYRPWALKIYQGNIYVGVMCSAETSQNAANVHAYVLKFDGATFSPYTSFSLPDPKGFVIHPNLNPLPDTGTKFQPWARQMTDITNFPGLQFFFLAYPQPILSAIDFVSDGRMVVGIMDRSGMQFGPYNYAMPPMGTTLVNAPCGGDVLMLCPDSNGVQHLESNGSCGGTVTTGAGNGEGPGGGEYFYEDNLTITHQELSLGSLNYLPNSDELMLLTFDSFEFEDGGQRTFDLSTGQYVRRYQLYKRQRQNGTFGKSVGLGDVEFLCDPAPVEIGNRVFKDVDSDGIQDPNEAGISGVTVRLYDQNDVLISSKTTANQGEYYFREADGLTTLSSYKIRLDNAADYQPSGPLDGLVLTIQDQGSDLHDSDGAVVNNFPEIALSTGIGGANNHTYDFGFHASCIATTEVCDGVDNDCDGLVDEDVCPTPTPSASPSPSPSPSASPSPSPSPSPSASPSPSPSPSPSDSPTPSPSESPSSSPTPSPTPSASPTPDETPQDCDMLDMSGDIAVIDSNGKALRAYAKVLSKLALKSGAPTKKVEKLMNKMDEAEFNNWSTANTQLSRYADLCPDSSTCVEVSNTAILTLVRGYADEMISLVKKIAKLVTAAEYQKKKKSVLKVSQEIYSTSIEKIDNFPKTVKDCN